MEIIGAVLNTSVEGINTMLDERDSDTLLKIVRMQRDYGAQRIALNCGSRFASEKEDLLWMAEEIHSAGPISLVVDSPDPEAHHMLLDHFFPKQDIPNELSKWMINSTSLEKHRMEQILPLVKSFRCQLTVILQDETGIPASVQDRIQLMPKLEEAAERYSIPRKDIFIDAGVFPLSTNHLSGKMYLETLRILRSQYPEYSTICGLNNISYGLPQEDALNSAFLAVLAAMGQTAAYVELTPSTGTAAAAVQTLLGEDHYCMEYLKRYRAGQLELS
ncbi:MAG: dihydropteroate synthase [Spirochaetales bacterium]|nr:dihydropteroate synthase [Spirochaetales bacterium]